MQKYERKIDKSSSVYKCFLCVIMASVDEFLSHLFANCADYHEVSHEVSIA